MLKKLVTNSFKSLKPLSYHKWTKWGIERRTMENPETKILSESILVTMNTNKVNAIDYEFISDLNGTLDVLKEHTDFPEHLPVVFCGAGTTFCAGFDMKLVMSLDEKELSHNFFTPLNNALEKLYLLNRPTCACINGHAVGPGFVLALACDFRIVHDNEDLQLGLREIELGLPLSSIPFEIARQQIPSPDPLYELIFSGRRIGTHEAYARMLMNEAIEEGDQVVLVACEFMGEQFSEETIEPFKLMKNMLKAPGIHKMRESGEGKKLDDYFIKRILNPTVRELVSHALTKKGEHEHESIQEPVVELK